MPDAARRSALVAITMRNPLGLGRGPIKLAPPREEERAEEHRVPGEFGEDARLDAVAVIGAAEEILRVKLLAAGVGQEVVEQDVEVLVADARAVAEAPERLDAAGAGELKRVVL